MGECARCGARSVTYVSGKCLCRKCIKDMDRERIEEKAKSVKVSSDFKTWGYGDLSELFWISLGRYIKNPNKYDLKILSMCRNWAAHADRGLSVNFNRALDWCKVDVLNELQRKDLPDV